jgi:hypothetical protein
VNCSCFGPQGACVLHGLINVSPRRNGETKLRKQGFVICLIALSLSLSAMASAQTTQSTTAAVERAEEFQANTPSYPVDGSSATTSAVNETEPTDAQQVDQDGQSGPETSVDTASGAPDVGTTPGTTAGKVSTPSATAPAKTTTTGYTFPTGSEMTHYWLRNVVGPRAAIGAAFTASWHTWVDTSPTEWHRDATGWSKRLGSSALDNSINQSSLLLLSRAMGQDPRYYRCTCSGFLPRTGHALKLVVTARNRSGNTVFSPAKIISPFTGPLVTRSTIYPDRFGPSDAFTAYYLVGTVAWNWIREFFWKSPRW